MTPHTSASWSSSATRSTTQAQQGRATESPLGPRSERAPEPGAERAPTSPTGGADINAQLAQALELVAKLAEEYRAVRLLCATFAGEASAHGERAHELGRQARERINADFNVDDPNTPPRASQKPSQSQHCYGPCPRYRPPKPGTCTARRRRSLSKRRSIGRKLGVPHAPARPRAG
jgi:hypothetical protein